MSRYILKAKKWPHEILKPPRHRRILMLLTVAFLILTAVYSSRAIAATHFRFVYTSSSNAIFVLSMLSWLTGLFLTAIISLTFEKVQWFLIAQNRGLRVS